MAIFNQKKNPLITTIAERNPKFAKFINGDSKAAKLLAKNNDFLKILFNNDGYIDFYLSKPDFFNMFLNNSQEQAKITLMEQWDSVETTNRKIQILEANARYNFGNSTDESNEMYKMIQTNQFPQELAWDFWVQVNQWADYWVNRYIIKVPEEKSYLLKVIKNMIRIAVLYGVVVLDKVSGDYGYGSITQNEIAFYMSNDSLSADFITSVSNGTITLKKDYKARKVTYDDAVYMLWRSTGIGDFVWCMRDLLLDVFMKKHLDVNTIAMSAKPVYNVANPDAFKKEMAIKSNPNFLYEVLYYDYTNPKGRNTPEEINKDSRQPVIMSMIMAYKTHVEVYYNKFGRQITSSKNQSLSSDANLSISSTQYLAKEHDDNVFEFVKQVAKQWQIEIDISVEEIDTMPENENADQQGKADKNTDSKKVEEKAENE